MGALGEGTRKPNRLRRADPLAQDLVAAVASTNGSNGNGANGITKAQARGVAVDFGGAVLEAASIETARHSDDVAVVVKALCEQLGVTGTERQDVLAAARLHDIGKIAIPAEVLTKSGPLSAAEWELMREHTVVGDEILSSVSSLEGIARLVGHSHERWDGYGYPDGLAGEEIPLGSRIIFCADAFHAIRCDRPYRAGKSAAASLAEVRRCAGTQFDTTVVEAFVEVVRELRIVPAPRKSPVKRSTRLTALLLVLAVGTGGSALARSGLLGDLLPGGESETSTESEVEAGAVPGDGGDLAPGIESSKAGTSAGTDDPGQPGPDQDSSAQSGSGDTGSSGAEGASSGGASESNGGQDHPHGGPPGQTGDHPQGGPPGQTGDHPQGAPPGQSGSQPQGGTPQQSVNQPVGEPPPQTGKGTPPASSKPK